MSIKMDNIEFKRVEKKLSTTIYARVLVQTKRIIPQSTINQWAIGSKEDTFQIIEQEMAMALMNHIYGELVVPINELAILAQHHITGANDAAEIQELRNTLRALLSGEEVRKTQ